MLHWLMRAKRWSQNPPSARQVKFVLAIIAVCIGVGIIERYVGWPDALTTNGMGRGRMPIPYQ